MALKIVEHPTVAERTERGKAARGRAPRSAHAEWEPRTGRRPIAEQVLEQSAGREPELVPVRHGRMLVSPFAFFRGSAAVMAGDLDGTPDSGIEVQLCGDAHVSNFGGFAAPDRELVFDMNDFDETTRGPWEWDIKRLVASLAVAGRDLGFSEADRREAAEAAAGSYRESMRGFAAMRNLDVWYARISAASILDLLGDRVSKEERAAFKRRVASARGKDSLRALSKLTQQVDGHPRIVSRPPLIIPVEELFPAADSAAIEDRMREMIRAYRQSLPPERRHLLETFRYAHMARRVGGVGSVGTRCWIVLLLGRDDADPLVLQVKEAGPSSLEPFTGRDPITHHGRRVVQGQRLMQVDGDIFLGWLRVDDPGQEQRDYYVRQLWDWKLSADIEQMPPGRLNAYGRLCAWTLARAHARSGDRVAIASYLGSRNAFDRALAAFAERYADQNERDYAALAAAVRDGQVIAEHGV